MQSQAAPPGDVPFVPNEVFRRIRKLYLVAVLSAMPLLFLALVVATSKSGFAIFSVLFFVAGVGLLIYALVVRAAAKCPRCASSLMWKSGPIIGTGRISLKVKDQCPTCKLDLNAEWDPAKVEPDVTAASEGTSP